MSDTFG